MDLEALRLRVNEIDDEIAKLFVERMQTSAKIAEAKAEKNLPVLDQKRENQVLQRVMDQAGEEFELYIKTLYHTMFEVSRSYQAGLLTKETPLSQEIIANFQEPKLEFPRKAIVACQGVEGSYAERACGKLFSMPNTMFFNSFESVFNAVEMGLCQYGVLPIENSSAGSVTEVYDLMVRHKFYVVKSLKLHINHALVTKKGIKLSDIKEIISHEQALQQCSEFLKSLPNVKVTVFENTATAAKYVAECDRTDIAALSSPECAKLYGLDILKEDVQNNANNYTRFICIAKNMEIYAGANKISLMLSVEHRPGSLHEMIGKVACQGLNLSKLESRPIPGKDFEFRFYFDIEGSVFSPYVLTLLKDMELSAEQLSFLGCYSEM
ncbi:bifunctional chorismate mutase/prephenate dehydratase [Anaerotignum propionicum]|uniref:Bifunctional chorismate mutase/prephenate dehydratase n=2 Tax=root TaxID=1 RepID=A0A0X1U761_ANAPI|nr:bifunctional chorismate mutase/prephenate dehydratase [Anaerotignum propionicum]AMJ40779.1 P-protein [Anaerotignum propionicum DSM 1682]SHE73195.1 chorismate mutase / prephenate dehydratase [[Clostridium] propionicum DSM 1682] [Anaerotignum propionicum DSM 1682]